MKPSLIVHGGAWDIPDEAVNMCKAGCERALAASWSILNQGGSALDAVEAAVIVLEDDPVFDAGFGSHLTLDGHAECDAIVMDGATLRAGSVAALRRIRNPIRLARQVLENCPHMMLVAEGAERFALKQGLELCAPEDLIAETEHDAWLKCRNSKHAAAHHRGHEQGTVGAVALDSNGRLFAATSTGGTCRGLPAPPDRLQSGFFFVNSAKAVDSRCSGPRRPRSGEPLGQTHPRHRWPDSSRSQGKPGLRLQHAAHGLRVRSWRIVCCRRVTVGQPFLAVHR